MRDLSGAEKQVKVSIHADADGHTGRECPKCEAYFKITFGTGRKGSDLPCHCPYCGHTSGQNQFATKEQIEYAKSVALREVLQEFYDGLKTMEFETKPTSGFGIGISMKFEGETLPPVQYYREKQLETEVLCENCTLKYMIYGVFAFCPDCGIHNSLQILNKNLDLAVKQVGLAAQVESDFSQHLISDALENAVSSFDGFGREICRINAPKATDQTKAEKISFQNPMGARTNFQQLFGKDFARNIDPTDWEFISRCAQKRHLLAHKMGVVDEHYLTKTGDRAAIEGRKVQIIGDDVKRLAACLRQLGQELFASL